MSYYERQYTTGVGNDPRNLRYAVFLCDVCGEKEEVQIRLGVQPDLTKARLCPICHSYGKDYRAREIKMKIEELTKTRSSVEVQIDQLERELFELQQTTVNEKGN